MRDSINDDLNRPETEEDGYRAQEFRVAKLYRNQLEVRDRLLASIRQARSTALQESKDSRDQTLGSKNQSTDKSKLK